MQSCLTSYPLAIVGGPGFGKESRGPRDDRGVRGGTAGAIRFLVFTASWFVRREAVKIVRGLRPRRNALR